MTEESNEDDVRSVLAVAVAADSPIGRAAAEINALTMHLPTRREPDICPTCAGRPWPCQDFHRAARLIHEGRLRVVDLVPPALHPRLWPRTESANQWSWPGQGAITSDEERQYG